MKRKKRLFAIIAMGLMIFNLTDTMYDSKQPTNVNHFTGNSLILTKALKMIGPFEQGILRKVMYLKILCSWENNKYIYRKHLLLKKVVFKEAMII
jgi:hypothetical protein